MTLRPDCTLYRRPEIIRLGVHGSLTSCPLLSARSISEPYRHVDSALLAMSVRVGYPDGEDGTLRKPCGRAGADADVERRLVAEGERLPDTCDHYRASCVARISYSIPSRRSRLRWAFFADDSLCGLHSRQPARRCLGRPRL